ncbi:MAG TPA: lytic transglycosylase domain-containing protein [Oligoflexia bacterium]|nr:lytic transglycosylase domain-containing protein [Oligoflexia bacterium]HMP47881.1 lytic transglycosylase domain-containing protein [Oligoflexia bacterium]
MKLNHISLIFSCLFVLSCSGLSSVEKRNVELEHLSDTIMKLDNPKAARHIRASIRPPSVDSAVNHSLLRTDNQNSYKGLATGINGELNGYEISYPAIVFKETPEVRKYMSLYKGKAQRDIQEPLKRRDQHLPVIEKVLRYFNLPLELSNLAFVESKFNEKAVSPRGALGLWQFMKPTAQELGLRCNFWKDEREDVLRSSIAAAKYLIDLHKRFKGDWLLTLAAYNAGPGRIASAVERAGGEADYYTLERKNLLPRETIAHVSRFIAVTLLQRGETGFVQDETMDLNTTGDSRSKFTLGDLPASDDSI